PRRGPPGRPPPPHGPGRRPPPPPAPAPRPPHRAPPAPGSGGSRPPGAPGLAPLPQRPPGSPRPLPRGPPRRRRPPRSHPGPPAGDRTATSTLDFRRGPDPARFMRQLGLEPDAWQADLLRSAAPQTLLLCSRQAGKSTVCAALALHEALYRGGSLALMLAPTQ